MPPDSSSGNGAGQQTVVHAASAPHPSATSTKCWATTLPRQHLGPLRTQQKRSANLTTIQPTRVKRSLQVQVIGAQLPPVDQPQKLLLHQHQHQQQQHQHLKQVAASVALLARCHAGAAALRSHASAANTAQALLSALQPRSPPTTQHRAPEPRMATNPAIIAPPPPYAPNAPSLLLGIRITITNNHGTRFGKVVDIQNSGRHKVLFDDGVCEWLSLTACNKWAWQTPRAVSAGLTPALCSSLRKHGCSNLAAELCLPVSGPPSVVPAPAPTSPDAAVGRHLFLWCSASGRWHEGVVMALSKAGTGLHHITYLDGAEEWVMLSHEVIIWKNVTHDSDNSNVNGNSSSRRQRHILPPSVTAVPEGEAAVNWRVAVYWPDDQTFFVGTLTKYLPDTHEYQMLYDDGEEEQLRLEQQEMMLWRCRIRDPADVRLTSTISRRSLGGVSISKRQRTNKSSKGSAPA